MFESNAVLLVLLLSTASFVSSYCPEDRIHSIGFCAFRVHCINSIRGVSLPDKCRGSVNHLVSVDVTLYDAVERFDDEIDTEFLQAVTSLKASAVWPKTSLSLLKYLPRLKDLTLTDNRIQVIEGHPFFKLKHLQHLDLSRNSLMDIEELFMFEDEPSTLKRLFLSNNAIEDLPGDTFSELARLNELDLSNNLISDLDEEPFSNLTSLEVLRLNNNRIKDLNGALNSLINLKHLYLRGNQIHNIDEPSLKIIYHLETFDVSGNQLERLWPIMLSRHWKHFDGVCKIILSENRINRVPNGTSKELAERFTRELKHKTEVLTELDLSKNNINKIEYNAFRSLVRLIKLDLSVNKLTDFIVNATDLKYVKNLNLSCNHIKNLYFESFSALVNLQYLDLSHNKLYSIPAESFTTNLNLKHVNMTFNEISAVTSLPFKMFHPDGGVLDLSNNGLTNFIAPFGQGLRLTVLVLNNNKIVDAASVNIIYQNEMKFLEMNKNGIQELNESSLRLPLSLTFLDLSFNAIHDIGPSSFHRVSQLKALYLGHNNLKEIQYGAFQGLSALTTLDLSFNKIKYLDSKVLMDLKSLTVLSLRYNGFYYLDYKIWLGHKFDLKVYVDGNNFTCNWLADALKDFNNGYSRMRPTVIQYRSSLKNSLENIPCVQDKSQNIVDFSSNNVLADERLLITNQKILEAVKEQTYFLRLLMNQLDVNTNSSMGLRYRRNP